MAEVSHRRSSAPLAALESGVASRSHHPPRTELDGGIVSSSHVVTGHETLTPATIVVVVVEHGIGGK